ncbi:preprotein translocase subunit SecG [Butyricicoccus faecihominis]|uniref:preprotein translocase subunit SecG n=1 Tax=Butyricicoccaceae TaxID=3085642 RepID=UPI00247AC1A4|nr:MULTISPECIES: preprotein translocase subunit SecG [Butyricicoccaceae]MCQ5130795.1 preprotein translocase subunit SecG [Butyricicoccus faecihominis]WNX85197.1 preprotein translocase subunit SecG [Agathobaculum sp. NTUH-O15-33]
MTTAQIALSIVMIVASLFLIIVVLLQSGASQGIGAVSGGAETFFGAGKASAADKILARLTTAMGVVFVVVALVLNLLH